MVLNKGVNGSSASSVELPGSVELPKSAESVASVVLLESAAPEPNSIVTLEYLASDLVDLKTGDSPVTVASRDSIGIAVFTAATVTVTVTLMLSVNTSVFVSVSVSVMLRGATTAEAWKVGAKAADAESAWLKLSPYDSTSEGLSRM